MTEWLEAQVADIRTRLSKDETALRLVFFAGPEGDALMTVSIDHFTDNYHRALVEGLASVLNRVGVETVLLAASRHCGRPSSVDRKLWQELPPLIDPHIELMDFVVVGDDTFWSAREDAGSHANRAR